MQEVVVCSVAMRLPSRAIVELDLHLKKETDNNSESIQYAMGYAEPQRGIMARHQAGMELIMNAVEHERTRGH